MPDDRFPRRAPRPSVPDDLQSAFLQEWWEERRDGISPRSMHEMLKGHIEKDEEHQAEILQRVTSLEADGKRDAEDRLAEKTGRFGILPPKSKPPPKAWWEKEPFRSVLKYVMILLAGSAVMELLHRFGVPAAHP